MSEAVINMELDEFGGEEYRERLQMDIFNSSKVPAPIYRHAAPSAPWPWMDFDVDPSEVHPLPPGDIVQDSEWCYYPQSLFGNWTHDQVERCRILKIKQKEEEKCKVYTVDVYNDGSFERGEEGRTFVVDTPRAYWDRMGVPPSPHIRVRALFVEQMTVPVLQILGTMFDVEPFFFASSVNWIPSRYQEDPKIDRDHITVVLPFIRTVNNPHQKPITRSRPVRTSSFPQGEWDVPDEDSLPYQGERQVIDTQAPLPLPDNRMLVQDLLAIHMYRTKETSTIISYHPSSEIQRTSAKRLQSLAQRTGDSVYWSKIFARSKDPTFFFLAILWYALYAWDEAFERVYHYINALESDVLRLNDIRLTRELHKLQAHLLYYQQLLRDFRVSVKFVRDTPNPAMSVLATDEERTESAELLAKEANNLISEIDRLTGQRTMLSERLQNVIHLAFASVSIEDSKAMQQLAKTTMIDSAAMKQIAYLTMIFLPASFLANVFSMNVKEINPSTTAQLHVYIEITLGLTFLTSWTAVALQNDSVFHSGDRGMMGMMERAFWPIIYIYTSISAVLKNMFRVLKRHLVPQTTRA